MIDDSAHAPLPRLTADTAPICGQYRTAHEDFYVEETPSYSPSGEGDHLFVFIEKKGLTTPRAVEAISRELGVDPRESGYAGMKDRHAVTRQWISVHGASPEAALALDLPGLRVLEARHHERKLRTGHLRSNRFVLRIRGVPPERDADLSAMLDRIGREGMPNYYGAQRFGRGDNVRRAVELASGSRRPPRAAHERKLLASSLQSFLFNRYVGERVAEGRLGRVEPGEIVKKEDTGGLFEVEDAAEVQSRMDRFEVSSTGPMFGPKMRWPSGAPRAREERLLASLELDEASLRRLGKFAAGTRRVVRVRPEASGLSREGADVWLEMTLPKGTYATTMLDELFKEGLVEGGGDR